MFVHTQIKKYFSNNKEEIDKKMIEYYEDNLFMCVQILLIWFRVYGRISHTFYSPFNSNSISIRLHIYKWKYNISLIFNFLKYL